MLLPLDSVFPKVLIAEAHFFWFKIGGAHFSYIPTDYDWKSHMWELKTTHPQRHRHVPCVRMSHSSGHASWLEGGKPRISSTTQLSYNEKPRDIHVFGIRPLTTELGTEKNRSHTSHQRQPQSHTTSLIHKPYDQEQRSFQHHKIPQLCIKV